MSTNIGLVVCRAVIGAVWLGGCTDDLWHPQETVGMNRLCAYCGRPDSDDG